MGHALTRTRLTPTDFLAWEDTQAERHEFVDGEIFAMVGARRVHNIVAGNLFAELKHQLKGTPCRPFIESAKLQVADDLFYPDVFVTCDASDLRTEQVFTAPTLIAEVLSPSTEAHDLFYPDVFVTCDASDLRTEQVFTAPTLIAEVLSPSTEAYDRGLKFTAYRRLASLREYLLIHPDSREVQLFRRGADGLFTLHDLSGQAEVACESIGCRVSAAELFDGLDALPGEVPTEGALPPA